MSVTTIQLEEQERLRLIETIKDYIHLINNDVLPIATMKSVFKSMNNDEKNWLLIKYNELLQKLDR